MRYYNSPYFSWNRTLYPRKGTSAVNLRSTPDVSGWAFPIKEGSPLGASTGRLAKANEADSLYWIEVTPATPVASYATLWVRSDVFSESATGTVPAPTKPAATASTPAPAPTKPATSADGDGKKCIENLVRNDKQTHAHLVKAQYHRERMAKRPRIGVIDTARDKELTALAARYNARQQKVKASALLKVTTGVSQATDSLMKQIKAMISGPGVGALPLVLVIPVALVTVSGLGYLVYKAFFEDEADSAQDVLNAAKLSQVYQSMDEAEQKLFEQTVQEAGNAGHKEGREDSENSFFSLLKNNILLVGAGVAAAVYVTNQSGGNKRK